MNFIELASNSFKINKWIWCYVNKTEANLASTNALAARCVRVIHAQCVLQFALLSRTLLRSSSNNEPSDPPYRIIFFCFSVFRYTYSIHIQWQTTMILLNGKVFNKTYNNNEYYIYIWLVIYIMVRHNHIYIYDNCAKVKFCLWMIWNQTKTVMIHTQVHLRIPCYDFYFL